MPIVRFTAVGPHAGKTITLDRFDFVDGVHMFEGSIDDARVVEKTLAEQYSAFRDDVLEDARRRYEDAQAEAALDGPAVTVATREVSLKERKIAQRFIDEGLDPVTVYGPGEAARMVQETMDALVAESEGGDNVVSDEELAAAAEKEAAEKEAAEKEAAEKEAAEKEAAEKEAAETAAELAKTEAAERAAKDEADRIVTEEREAERLVKQQSQDDGGAGKRDGAKIETVADALQALDPADNGHWTARGVPSIDAVSKLLGRPVTRSEVETAAPDFTRSVAKAAANA